MTDTQAIVLGVLIIFVSIGLLTAGIIMWRDL